MKLTLYNINKEIQPIKASLYLMNSARNYKNSKFGDNTPEKSEKIIDEEIKEFKKIIINLANKWGKIK